MYIYYIPIFPYLELPVMCFTSLIFLLYFIFCLLHFFKKKHSDLEFC